MNEVIPGQNTYVYLEQIYANTNGQVKILKGQKGQPDTITVVPDLVD